MTSHRQAFRAVHTGLSLIDRLPIDILAGSDVLRKQIEGGTPREAIALSWREDEQAFERLRRAFLLY